MGIKYQTGKKKKKDKNFLPVISFWKIKLKKSKPKDVSIRESISMELKTESKWVYTTYSSHGNLHFCLIIFIRWFFVEDEIFDESIILGLEVRMEIKITEFEFSRNCCWRVDFNTGGLSHSKQLRQYVSVSLPLRSSLFTPYGTVSPGECRFNILAISRKLNLQCSHILIEHQCC